ncbi:hypothetical protein SS05631_c03570 [Sinorhizobium sp. CCBAU 05631]|nr:hypothetical protein SS05631_c03570 [Sinorhizobium sp. CCBAU 05631]
MQHFALRQGFAAQNEGFELFHRRAGWYQDKLALAERAKNKANIQSALRGNRPWQ